MRVNYCGIHAIHTKGFRIDRPGGSGDYLFLHLKAPTRFMLDGKAIVARNNEILLYRRGTPQIYEGVEDIHIDDFMHFSPSCAKDVEFIERLSLEYDRPIQVNFLQPLLSIHQNICHEYLNSNENQMEALNCLVRYFLIKLKECVSTAQNSLYQDDLVSRLYALRIQMYASPNARWTVSDMAQEVNLSPSYFQAMYKKLFNISCISDLIVSRMVRAKQMLTFSSSSIGEISRYCGYEAESYFARQFREKVGMTPLQYRNSSRSQHETENRK